MSIYVHEEWLLKVWFFREVEPDFLTQARYARDARHTRYTRYSHVEPDFLTAAACNSRSRPPRAARYSAARRPRLPASPPPPARPPVALHPTALVFLSLSVTRVPFVTCRWRST